MDPAARVIGIGSALVLFATLLWQLRAQWRSRSSEGVSKLLFVGQLLASTGFAVYSALIGDVVFVATNVVLGVAAIAGVAITFAKRRRGSGAWRDRAASRGIARPRHARAASRRADRGRRASHGAC